MTVSTTAHDCDGCGRMIPPGTAHHAATLTRRRCLTCGPERPEGER